MRCDNCGRDNDDRSRFCEYCGAPLPEKKEKSRLPLIIACAVLALVVGVAAGTMLFVGKGGEKSRKADNKTEDSGSQDISEMTELPSVVDEDGREVSAIERPKFFPVSETSKENRPDLGIDNKGNQKAEEKNGENGSGNNGSKVPAAQEAYLRPVVPKVEQYTLEPSLGNVDNVDDFYLTDNEKDGLQENIFFVSNDRVAREFHEIYENNRYDLTPNFVTVDSMMHTYHLYFSHLLKNTEREKLSGEVQTMSVKMLNKSIEQYKELKGTEWEEAAFRNVVFFAVGTSLIGGDGDIPSDTVKAVRAELDKITAHDSMEECVITGELEDYSQYIPRGYYEGDELLERYFKTMMWYGRANFTQKEEVTDRCALLISLAMHDPDVLPHWEAVYTVTSFFAGASDDCGYYEYYPIIEAVYGEDPSAEDLIGDKDLFGEYHSMTEQMRAPQINSVPVYHSEEEDVLDSEKGYRFMGQRFTLDAMIFQNLIYDDVEKKSDNTARMLPDALDIPAAMGSDEALSILDMKGATDFPGYTENLEKLREGIEQAPSSMWEGSLYSQWLYTLKPLLDEKGDGYPAFMQTSAWSRKNLQTYLGSYTELKHDTILYSKQVMPEMGGGPTEERDDRGYVEPEPEVFARLSNLTQATCDGLDHYKMLSDEDRENLNRLRTLSDRLADISEKELKNELPSDDDFELIRTYGGQLEHFWLEVYKDESEMPTTFDFPAAIVADIATDPESGMVLEIGTGYISEIYVVVPIDGELHVAEGGIYSFYQFEQPASERMTDLTWRQKLGIIPEDSGEYHDPLIEPEEWTNDFRFDYQYE